MSSKHGATASFSPENIVALKDKYGLDEAGLKEVLGKVEIISPLEAKAQPARLPEADGDKSGEAQLMKQIGRGDVSMAEALMYMDLMDRKDRRERRDRKEEERENNGNQTLKAEDIGKELRIALQQVGVTGKPAAPEEIPEWAKPIMDDNKAILSKLKGEEEDKKLTTAIKEATGPLKAQLEKTQEKIATLSQPAPEGSGPPKSDLTVFLEMRNMLKEEGIIGSKSNIMLGPDGQPIPIKGEIPAALVFGPYLVKQILEAVEQTAENIGKKYGLIGEEKPTGMPKISREALIKMPQKPKPAVKPVEPITEAPVEEVKIIPKELPTESILEMPQRPTEEIVEEVIEETIIPVPCAQCGVNKELLPNGLCKPCATEIAKEVKAPKKPAAVEAGPTITYVCNHCGAGGFEKPNQIALHSRNCPEAIEARKKAKKKEKNNEQTPSDSK